MQSNAEVCKNGCGWPHLFPINSRFLFTVSNLGHICSAHISLGSLRQWLALLLKSNQLLFCESINKNSSDFQSESFPVLKAAQHLVSQPNTDITWLYSSFNPAVKLQEDGCDEHMHLQDRTKKPTPSIETPALRKRVCLAPSAT